MHQGRRPLTRRSGRVWAQAAAIVCVAVLGLVAVAAAAPKGDQGPPAQAHGNGPPPAPPQAGGNGQAKKAAGGATQSPAGTQGKPPATHTSNGGHSSSGAPSKARGNGDAQPAPGVTTGGQAPAQGHAVARGHADSGTSGRHTSSRARSGKVKVCHATGSGKHPYVEINVSANTVHAHERHPDARDIVPAGGGCSAGASQAGGDENAPSGTPSPPAGEHGHSNQSGDTPTGDDDTVAVSDEGGTGPGADGGVLGADEGGGDDSGATAEATSASLPFTGLGLGLLVAMGAMLALAGLYVRRKAA